jgi:hypothetical protein
VPAWALRVAAVIVTALSMIGSTSYALAHPKNPNAPLQPPVADKSEPAEPEPTPAATLPFRTVAPTVAPTPTATPSITPAARAASTLAAAVRASATAPPTSRATAAATLRPTPVPQITLGAGVRATSLPKVTYTHSS